MALTCRISTVSRIVTSTLTQRLLRMAGGDNARARIIRGAFGSAGIRLLNRLLIFVLGVVLARGLGAQGYGIYAYAFAIMTLLMVLAEAGMPRLLLREASAAMALTDGAVLQGVLRRTRQIVAATATGVSVVGLLGLLALGPANDPAVLYTTGLMLLLLPAAALTKLIAYGMVGLNHVVIGKASELLVRPIIVLVLVSTGFLIWPHLREPQYAMAAQLFAGVFGLLVGASILNSLVPISAKTRSPEYRDRAWLKSAGPFMLIGGAGVVNGHADMIMLGWFGEPEEVGVYRVAVQGAALVAFGLHAVNPIIAPEFSRLYAQSNIKQLQRVVTASARAILVAALPVVLLFTLYGTAIVSWVFGSEYTDADMPLVILSVAQLINAGYGSVGLLMTMTGHENDAARTMWTTASINIVLNAILIPWLGMNGAALASAISLIVWNAVLFRKVRTNLNISSTAFGRVHD